MGGVAVSPVEWILMISNSLFIFRKYDDLPPQVQLLKYLQKYLTKSNWGSID